MLARGRPLGTPRRSSRSRPCAKGGAALGLWRHLCEGGCRRQRTFAGMDAALIIGRSWAAALPPARAALYLRSTTCPPGIDRQLRRRRAAAGAFFCRSSASMEHFASYTASPSPAAGSDAASGSGTRAETSNGDHYGRERHQKPSSSGGGRSDHLCRDAAHRREGRGAAFRHWWSRLERPVSPSASRSQKLGWKQPAYGAGR